MAALLVVWKHATDQNGTQPLHQNVIQPNANRSIKMNKPPVFNWGKVNLASFFLTTEKKEFLNKNARKQKKILKNNFSLLEMEYMMAIVISSEYSV